jgi:hypothetical protein
MFICAAKLIAMRKVFYVAVLSLILFEVANVYFIMPMPGSQQMNSINLAYFLYHFRWVFRVVLGLLILVGLPSAFSHTRLLTKIVAVVCLLLLGGIAYATNFIMAADAMFLPPKKVQFANAANSKVDSDRMIIGIAYKGQAKAYSIQYLGYHHQVLDTIAAKPVMVTYCTVCRTGRVFEPVINQRQETFRLVGMDHFNAMFEDKTTKSWWRQVTGEAIAGKLKGQQLPEFPSTQMSLGQWLLLYPNSLIMQPDTVFSAAYTAMKSYEGGLSKSNLTKRDTVAWQDKAWVVGVVHKKETKAYDWITLQEQRIIYDVLNQQPIALILASDNKSFVALQRTDINQRFTLTNDTLSDIKNQYTLLGKSANAALPDLVKLPAYQEYWHSWRTFHPTTKR